jgi:hypothetical protein
MGMAEVGSWHGAENGAPAVRPYPRVRRIVRIWQCLTQSPRGFRNPRLCAVARFLGSIAPAALNGAERACSRQGAAEALPPKAPDFAERHPSVAAILGATGKRREIHLVVDRHRRDHKVARAGKM